MQKSTILKKTVLSAILFLTVGVSLNAQVNKALLDSKLFIERGKNNWTNDDISDYKITDQYTEKETGITYAYTQQRYHNIAVFNAMSVFLLKDNKVFYFKPGIIGHAKNKVSSELPVLNAEDAIRFAVKNINGKEYSPAKLISRDEDSQTFSFDIPDLSDRIVTVQLVYQPTESALLLAWNVSIEMKHSSDWWNIRIDALNGNFIEKNNYTVECNFGGQKTDVEYPLGQLNRLTDQFAAPPVVPSYNVFPFPYEAPTFISSQLLTDPSDPVASPYGWHDINGVAGAEYTITNGNNVYAATDVNADNLPDYSPNGGSNLDFNFVFGQSTPPINNRDASVTNLFYINNKIHDVLYHLGFNEAAGNFQVNNYGKGGLGNDQVKADAMDGSGTNNANFATPVDGSAPRMQMYMFSGSPYQYDGSFDNGVIIHEYGHGLSNRLTGGPANASCLNNIQSGGMGEGWSDYLALMMTMKTGDAGTNGRGMGTYVLGQTTSGNGIRRKKYSTDMSIDPLELGAYGTTGTTAYGVTRSTEVHNSGEIWCSALWDMSWLLIDQYGFNSNWQVTTSGNYIALKLVIQGMKLQVCNPGFINARDAILSADTLLYGAANACKIWQAFARRGMGYVASQGASSSSTTITADYSFPPSCLTTAPLAAFQSNVNTLACGNTVNFTDLSLRTVTYLWNFGDATTSTLANPSHTYAAAGTYIVTLTATNPAGSNSVSHTIISTQSPVSAFTIVDPSVIAGDNVVFINQSANACSYAWTFGDAGTSTLANPSHIYATPGTYTVSLVVTNPSGTHSVSHTVFVDVLHINAGFYVDKSSVSCGSTVSFTNTSVQSTSWIWDFGDQSTSTAQNPVHTYPIAGNYSVKLIAFNSTEKDSLISTITVTQSITANVTATPSTICWGDPVQLNVTGAATTNVQYALNSIPYSPVAGTGTVVTLADDALSAFLPVGFTFKFCGVDYTQFKICSNGYITFNSTASTTNMGSSIPNTAAPNNIVALAWADLYPPAAGSSVNYFTTGVSPNRKLVVNLSTVFFDDQTKHAIAQALFYEGTNVIELHMDTVNVPVGKNAVQGIEAVGGISGIAIPGRNFAFFAVNDEGWRFTPTTFSYTWIPGNLSGATQTVNPVSTGSYTVNISDGAGCIAPIVSPAITVNICIPVVLNLKLFLQGYYIDGGIMQPVLNNHAVPLSLASQTDTITVELHHATTYALVEAKKALLSSDGTVSVSFLQPPGNYYLAIRHRNSIQTWTTGPISCTAATPLYDFTTAANKAMGDNQVQVQTGKWAFYTGDLNQDDFIDSNDFPAFDNDASNGVAQVYTATDMNGDGFVDSNDFPVFDNNASNGVTAVHP